MTLRERLSSATQAMVDYVTGKTRRATTDRPAAPAFGAMPPGEVASAPEYQAVDALRQLVAWQMYDKGMPLDHVKAADPTGRVAAAIEALAADMLAEQTAADQAAKEATFAPKGPSWPADALWYDQVRRLAEIRHIPVNDLDDLDAVAETYGWTRDSIAAELAAHDVID